jgi:hypothetical protein
MSIPRRRFSPPVAVEFASSAAITPPARATFPFMPASTLIALQNLQVVAENRSSAGCHDGTPPYSRPRPAVTDSTLQQHDIFYIEIDEDSTEETPIGSYFDSAVFDGEQSKVQSNDPGPSTADNIRRTTVAIAGGTILSVGLVLIPFPIVPGSLIAYGGLMILATEFDSARKAIDTVKKPLSKWLADDEEEEVNTTGDEMWRETMSYKSNETGDGRWREIILYKSNESRQISEDVDGADGRRSQIKAMKHFLRKVLMLDSEDAETNKRRDAGQSKQDESDRTDHIELFGCGPCDYDEHDDANEMTRMPHSGSQRLSSDGGISSNALEEGNELLPSRQENFGSSGNGSDCFWVTFSCNPFQDEAQRQRPPSG